MITPFDTDQARHELVAPLRHETLVVTVHDAGADRVRRFAAPERGWSYPEIAHIVDGLARARIVYADAFLGRNEGREEPPLANPSTGNHP